MNKLIVYCFGTLHFTLLHIDGVRVFSMSWVVLGHLFVFPVELVGYSNQGVDLYKLLFIVS